MPPVNIDRNLKDIDPAWLTVPIAWTLAVLVAILAFATGSGPDEQARRSTDTAKPPLVTPEARTSDQAPMP